MGASLGSEFFFAFSFPPFAIVFDLGDAPVSVNPPTNNSSIEGLLVADAELLLESGPRGVRLIGRLEFDDSASFSLTSPIVYATYVVGGI